MAGTPKAIKTEDGSLLDLNAVIRDVVKDDAHVWVLIRGTFLPMDELQPFSFHTALTCTLSWSDDEVLPTM
jgi:hypothetical protein